MPRIATDSSDTDTENDNVKLKSNAELVSAVVNELLDISSDHQSTNYNKRQLVDQPTKRQRDESATLKRTKSKTVLIENFVESTLLPLIADLNNSLQQIPKSYTNALAMTIYERLCEKNKLIHSPTTQAIFKFDNFLRCVGMRFPETASANIIVRYILFKFQLYYFFTTNIC